MTTTIRPANPGELAVAVAIDDEATALYTSAGLDLSLPEDSPFVLAEQATWQRAIELGRLFFAVDPDDHPLAFCALDTCDGHPYLAQLSVRASAMRRGLGRLLLGHAVALARESGADSLWLTTYGHLPWNRPFYESAGFVVVPEPECGPDIREHLDEERRFLPAPDHRVAMRLTLR